MEWMRNNKVIKEPIVDYLERIFDEEMAKGYKMQVAVGTDSQKSTRWRYKFATVILITTTENLGGGVTVGRGGLIVSSTYFHDFKPKDIDTGKGKFDYRGKEKSLVNERMVFEVGKSVEAAYEIAPLLDLYEIPLEIHADINPNPMHESNKALQEAVGYILGMGYSFKVKPDAFCASHCADNLV